MIDNFLDFQLFALFASTDFQSVVALSGPEVGICREKHI